MMFDCPICDAESMISVAQLDGIEFFSCSNEKCVAYSELFINVGKENDPEFYSYESVLGALNETLSSSVLVADDENCEE